MIMSPVNLIMFIYINVYYIEIYMVEMNMDFKKFKIQKKKGF